MLCDVFIQLMDAEKGRKAIGGKVEIKLRIREPLTDKDVEILTQKWLVIEAFVVPSNRVSVFRLRLHRMAFLSDVKNTYPYLLGTLFSEELLQRRDVRSASESCTFRNG